MAYNLDFSGWQDMRRAMSDSILNQANIQANVIANRYNTIAKTISSLGKNALWAYGESQKAKTDDMTKNATDVARAANNNLAAQGYTGLAIDPDQAVSAVNGVEERKKAQLVNGLLRYI